MRIALVVKIIVYTLQSFYRRALSLSFRASDRRCGVCASMFISDYDLLCKFAVHTLTKHSVRRSLSLRSPTIPVLNVDSLVGEFNLLKGFSSVRFSFALMTGSRLKPRLADFIQGLHPRLRRLSVRVYQLVADR